MDLEQLIIIIVSVIAFILLITVIVLLVLRNKRKVNLPLAAREYNALPRDENGRIDPDAYEEWKNALYQRNPDIANQIGMRPSERYEPPELENYMDPEVYKRTSENEFRQSAYISYGYYPQPNYERDRMRQEYEENARRERALRMNDYRAR